MRFEKKCLVDKQGLGSITSQKISPKVLECQYPAPVAVGHGTMGIVELTNAELAGHGQAWHVVPVSGGANEHREAWL